LFYNNYDRGVKYSKKSRTPSFVKKSKYHKKNQKSQCEKNHVKNKIEKIKKSRTISYTNPRIFQEKYSIDKSRDYTFSFAQRH